MLEDHAKLMALIQYAGEIIGRKKFQKILYILKKLEYPFQEKFQFHFYGPYSEELTLQIEELCNLNFVAEVREEKGGYHQYRYTVTEEGTRFLENFQIDLPQADMYVDKLNTENSRFLELVSTLLFFDHLSEKEVIEKVEVVKQKQHYTEEEMQNGLNFIRNLRKQRVS